MFGRVVIVACLWPALHGCTGLTAYNDFGQTDDTEDTWRPWDTDDTDVDAAAPRLSTFEAQQAGGGIQIVFTATDPDGDMEGGTFHLTVDGTPSQLSIPSQIDVWNPGGASRIDLASTPCQGGSHSYSGRIVDQAGHSSGTSNDSLTTSGSGSTVSETGDDSASLVDLGQLGTPSSICGDIYQASNDGSTHTGDRDWFAFTATSSGDWTFNLDWDAGDGDYDIYLLDGWFLLYMDYEYLIAGSDEFGSNPEAFTTPITSGEVYVVEVAAWDGGTGNWMLSIQ